MTEQQRTLFHPVLHVLDRSLVQYTRFKQMTALVSLTPLLKT